LITQKVEDTIMITFVKKVEDTIMITYKKIEDTIMIAYKIKDTIAQFFKQKWT
jgi:hypothetical protein